MTEFKTIIKKYGENAEKTGWTYIDIPRQLAEKLNPGNKKSFRVKGSLDKVKIEAMALVPVGGGDFILPLKKELRKALKKDKGASVHVNITRDENPDPFPVPEDFRDCLQDEPAAFATFFKLPKSHRNYFVKWIEGAKSDGTRVKRIALAVNALSQGQGYGEMLRSQKNSGD